MISKACCFSTDRLIVKEWHSLSDDDWVAQDLADVVVNLLTDRVTQSLPEAWRGSYTSQRAQEWIQDRDDEGAVLLVVDRSSRESVGLVILFEADQERAVGAELRLGYLLAESVWGKGLASEMIQGLVAWCRRSGVSSIVGGVARGNVSSRRVLEKSGFTCDAGTEEAAEQMFELKLR